MRNEQGLQSETLARTLVNAGGPWVKRILADVVRVPTSFGLKLVKGSHIVVPRLYAGEHAFILQNTDRRVVFAYPYQHRYTLIGTTDVELSGAPGPCAAGADEIDYLCRAVNLYFSRKVTPHDVVWSYCGIRPLFDDGSSSPSAVTRDYMLRLDGKLAPPESPARKVSTDSRRLSAHVPATSALALQDSRAIRRRSSVDCNHARMRVSDSCAFASISKMSCSRSAFETLDPWANMRTIPVRAKESFKKRAQSRLPLLFTSSYEIPRQVEEKISKPSRRSRGPYRRPTM
jgi:hypothetical protein